MEGVDGGNAELAGPDAVARHRASSTLDVAEDRGTAVMTGGGGDGIGKTLGQGAPGKVHVTEGIGRTVGLGGEACEEVLPWRSR